MIESFGMNIEPGDNPLKRSRNPLIFVALGVIFLFVLLGLRSGGEDTSAFLLPDVENSMFAAQVIGAFGETPELILVGEKGVLAATPPVTVTPQILGAIIGGFDSDISAEIIKYVVEDKDTISSISEQFNISVNTILWANDLNSNSALRKGQILTVLPVSGALHLVRPSDTLSEIAGWYKADADNIVSFNGLASAAEIYAGDLIVIPDGIQPKVLPSGRLTPIPNSYFIYPVPAPYRMTQGLHPYNAVDFSNGKCSESVYAAAGGTIQKTGYTSIGGRYVRILHPNGVVTYYGHLSATLVKPGDRIFQGQIVGYTGSTGYTIPAGSAGCHLHFEVRGAVNPFNK
ncbi:MAG: LysM peptidoglycan-binding domain-containing M23 family metallopeptidase [Patescibacteria group bacterium]|nr:LysM peptidoglycan-binding domain-containing M23 family metallopeptidase [Patescibacteria group bacterium]